MLSMAPCAGVGRQFIVSSSPTPVSQLTKIRGIRDSDHGCACRGRGRGPTSKRERMHPTGQDHSSAPPDCCMHTTVAFELKQLHSWEIDSAGNLYT